MPRGRPAELDGERLVELGARERAIALAGLGGAMLGLTEGVQWNMGFRILLYMFAAAVLGGLGSPIGAMLGGLTLGLVAEVGSIWIPSDFKFVMSLGALILVLLIRPQGFFGLKERVG